MGERFKHKETPNFTKEEVAFTYPEYVAGAELRGVYTVFTPEKTPRGDVVLTPGVGEFRSSFEPFAIEFVRQGYRVIVTEHADLTTPPDDILEKEFTRAKINALSYWSRLGIPKEEVQKVLNSIHAANFREAYGYMLSMADMKARFGVTSAVEIGHSAGAFAMTIAHLLWPEALQRGELVLLNPAGFTGKIESKNATAASEKVRDTHKEAAREAWQKKKHTTELSVRYLIAVFATLNLSIIRDSLKYTGERANGSIPIVDALREDAPMKKEAVGMANTDLRPMLEMFQKNSKKVTTIVDDGDPLFPMRKVEDNPPAGTLLRTKKFGHFGPLTAPVKLAREIIDRVL